MAITPTATATVAATTVTVTATPPFPIYFETGWGVISSVNLLLIGVGIMVIGIVGLNRLSIIPVIVSTAAALANGLCYYAFYTNYPVSARRGATAVADMAWGIQEIGSPFYLYFILKKILPGKQRMFFLCAYWAFTFALVVLRICITVLGTIALSDHTSTLGPTITRLHNSYFSVLAATECMSSFLLLKMFYKAGKRSKSVGMDRKATLFQHLARSTEIRLATLAGIGIMRACTYSFANAKSSGMNQSTQLDRLASVMLNVFPVIMMVDLLSARLSHTTSQYYTGHGSSDRQDSSGKKSDAASSNRQPNGVDTIARDFGEYMGPGFSPRMHMDGITPASAAVRNYSIGSLYETHGGGQTMKISPLAYSLGTLPDIKEFPYAKHKQNAPSGS